jgi:predicted O-linked N-acetylglucosamine transferase (SPINDLY family)
MPGSYQPNDNKRNIANTGIVRNDFGISESTFVMACLNTNYKITEREFEAWFSILQQLDNSILVLLATNKWAVENIYAAAKRRKIDKNRIKFFPKIGYEKHLERLKIIDVFVDTFRINAHTSASDALWAGVPVVTLMGQQFAARVAASLLASVGLQELITSSVEEYKEKIIKLGTDKAFFTDIKTKLETSKVSASLFNTKQYTSDFEALLVKAFKNFENNSKAIDIELNE